MLHYKVDYLEWGEYPTHTTEYEGSANSLKEIREQLYNQTIGSNSSLEQNDYKNLFVHETLYITGIEGSDCFFSTGMLEFMSHCFDLPSSRRR